MQNSAISRCINTPNLELLPQIIGNMHRTRSGTDGQCDYYMPPKVPLGRKKSRTPYRDDYLVDRVSRHFQSGSPGLEYQRCNIDSIVAYYLTTQYRILEGNMMVSYWFQYNDIFDFPIPFTMDNITSGHQRNYREIA